MKRPPSSVKLRGAYYTPTIVADFLARWAIQSPSDEVLEPSAGDGIVLHAAAERLLSLARPDDFLSGSLLGVEIDEKEAEKCWAKMADMALPEGYATVKTEDFFSFAASRLHASQPLFDIPPERQFDVILGNPPFIRYQNFPENQRAIAFEIMNRAGMRPNRLTNAWLPFLVISSLLLSKDGRIGMVIPAELLQVNYAAETRQFLADYFDRITLITFKKLVFSSVQQEVVLLLAERTASTFHGIRTIELNSQDDLVNYDHASTVKAQLKRLDHSTEKWTQYFLTRPEINLMRKLKGKSSIRSLKEFVEVDVGLVTGQNDFFVLNQSSVTARHLQDDVKKLVAKSAQLKGIEFTEKDWNGLVSEDQPTYLFSPSMSDSQISAGSKKYVTFGEDEGLNRGYKCSIRKIWYQVPSQWVPDGFMLRQVHLHPKLILNKAKAMSTDTVHRVRFKEGTNPMHLACAFINSLTFAFAEISGRSYGGGVLTFEPSEIEGLPLPIESMEDLDYRKIDTLVRAGRIEEALDINDRVLLRQGLSMPSDEVEILRAIWKSLRSRRTSRRA